MGLEVVIIAAVAENNIIGRDGKIPWRIPEDVERFRELTMNHPVVMGWKTYESIPEEFRPLPGRLNLVLSKSKNYPGVFMYNNLEKALNDLNEKKPYVQGVDYSQTFLIGGQRVYEEGLKHADRMEITRVHKEYEGDAFFPEIKSSDWKIVFEGRRKNYTFFTYRRA